MTNPLASSHARIFRSMILALATFVAVAQMITPSVEGIALAVALALGGIAGRASAGSSLRVRAGAAAPLPRILS